MASQISLEKWSYRARKAPTFSIPPIRIRRPWCMRLTKFLYKWIIFFGQTTLNISTFELNLPAVVILILEKPLADMAISLFQNSNKFEKINCVAWKLLSQWEEKWFRPGNLECFANSWRYQIGFMTLMFTLKISTKISIKQILNSKIEVIKIEFVQWKH